MGDSFMAFRCGDCEGGTKSGNIAEAGEGTFSDEVDVWLEVVGRVKDYSKGSDQGRSWDIETPMPQLKVLAVI